MIVWDNMAEVNGMDKVPRSRRLKKRLLSLAGAWRGLDADRMIEELYKARREAPVSPPVRV